MDMMWTEKMSVGNVIIDNDHKELLGLIMALDSEINTKNHAALPRALKLLKGCMNRHFYNEELFAHALGIPFAMHKVAHQNMQTEIDFLMYEIEKGSVATTCAIEHYSQFLRDWLIKHIAEEDMQMKPLLQAHPYDLKIDGISL